MLEAVFFDLDGTLADTAPDLGGALNRLREDDGLPPLPLAVLRPHTSHGVRGLLQAGLAMQTHDPRYGDYARRFLVHYERSLCEASRLFPGMADLLAALDALGVKWGVVTNKAVRYTLPLLEGLGLSGRSACIIGGDSALRPKPSPAPLLMACAVADVPAAGSVFVGDDLRDVEAGRAAGMLTLAATYGYLGEGLPVADWGADGLVDSPAQVLPWVGPCGC